MTEEQICKTAMGLSLITVLALAAVRIAELTL